MYVLHNRRKVRDFSIYFSSDAANNSSTPPLLDYTEFYNSALDHMDLMQDYFNWQSPQHPGQFSYCQYPFILSIVAKRIILTKVTRFSNYYQIPCRTVHRSSHTLMHDNTGVIHIWWNTQKCLTENSNIRCWGWSCTYEVISVLLNTTMNCWVIWSRCYTNNFYR
jgi:hypothetical protein